MSDLQHAQGALVKWRLLQPACLDQAHLHLITVVAGELQAVQQAIASCNKQQITSCQQQIERFEEQITSFQQKIERFEEQYNDDWQGLQQNQVYIALQQQLAALRQELAAVQRQLAALREELAALRGRELLALQSAQGEVRCPGRQCRQRSRGSAPSMVPRVRCGGAGLRMGRLIRRVWRPTCWALHEVACSCSCSWACRPLGRV